MRKLTCLLTLSVFFVATRSALAVIVAGDNPSGPTSLTAYLDTGSGYSVAETVSYDGTVGAWRKELINNRTQPIPSGQEVSIHEQLTNAGPRGWTDWHEAILPTPSDPPFPDFLFTAGSLQVARNGVPLTAGVDYTLSTTIDNSGIGITPGGDWVALSIFFNPSAVIQPGDTLGITKNIFEVFGDSDIWDVGEFAQLGQYPTVPEPSSLVLSLFAAAGLAALAIRKRRV
jgi:hypothetical protein